MGCTGDYNRNAANGSEHKRWESICTDNNKCNDIKQIGEDRESIAELKMFYIFQSGVEFVKLKIDRKEKKLEIATSNVNYRFIPQPFWKLFGDKKDDIEEAEKELRETENLNDDEFEKYLTKEFLKRGYTLVKKNKEVINQKEYYKDFKVKNIQIKD